MPGKVSVASSTAGCLQRLCWLIPWRFFKTKLDQSLSSDPASSTRFDSQAPSQPELS